MKRILLITLALTGLFVGIKNTYSQDVKIDSLIKELKTAKEDTNKVNILNKLSEIGGWRIGNYDTTMYYAQTAMQLAEKLEFKKGIATGYNNIGVIYRNQGNYPEALKNFLILLKIHEEIGDKGGTADAYNHIGIIYRNQGNYPEALKNYFTSLKIFEEIGDKSGIAINYINIGIIYKNQDNYPKALKNLFAALKIFEEIGDKGGIAPCYLNIGNTYTKMRDAKKGKEWLEKALNLSKEIGMKEHTKYIYLGLTSADSTLGDFKSALESYKLYTIYKDSLFNEENTKKLTQTEMQFAFDKKQLADSLQNAQLRTLAGEKLEKQKIFTGVGSAIALLFLGFSVVIFKNNKKLSAEKRKSEGLLLNILPEEISAELKERGAATAHEFESVTVLFTDFVNFTIAGERMSPTELIEELHHCFKAFDEIIGKYHIEKIKTVGDAYLAVSGLPKPEPDHAQHIVKAGLEIRDFMLRRRAELGDRTFEIRIGIHSGSVVAGIVGVKKFAYDIWGDTVNTAARMEQNSEVGKVNISGITYELVKDEFECTYRGKVQAKNKGEVDMYFVK